MSLFLFLYLCFGKEGRKLAGEKMFSGFRERGDPRYTVAFYCRLSYVLRPSRGGKRKKRYEGESTEEREMEKEEEEEEEDHSQLNTA